MRIIGSRRRGSIRMMKDRAPGCSRSGLGRAGGEVEGMRVIFSGKVSIHRIGVSCRKLERLISGLRILY